MLSYGFLTTQLEEVGLVEVARKAGLRETVDVLQDQEIRNGIKEYSEWPTIPQLYVHGEFVAAQSSHKSAPGNRFGQSPPGLDDGSVAGIVASSVVDLLQIVEVDDQQVRAALRSKLVDPGLKGGTVGKSGQRVGVGHSPKRLMFGVRGVALAHEAAETVGDSKGQDDTLESDRREAGHV